MAILRASCEGNAVNAAVSSRPFPASARAPRLSASRECGVLWLIDNNCGNPQMIIDNHLEIITDVERLLDIPTFPHKTRALAGADCMHACISEKIQGSFMTSRQLAASV